MRPIDAFKANMDLVEIYNQETGEAQKDALRKAMAVIRDAPTVTLLPNTSQFVGGPGDDTIELIQPPHSNDMALKPCPYCGSESIWYEKYLYATGPRWRCWCADCLAGIDPGCAQNPGIVREMWNRRATQPNPPLTLDELREMDGGAVFIQPPDGDSGVWALIDLEFELCRTAKGGLSIFDTYGKTWLAYRCKPREDAT